MSDDETRWGCVLPFLTDDPAFAHGVEVGMLWERMKSEDAITGTFLTANQDQITLMAARAGWAVDRMEVAGDDFTLEMHRPG